MGQKQFSVKRHHQRLRDVLRATDVENALLFCNHVLAAQRGLPALDSIAHFERSLHHLSSPFLVHLAAREVLLKCIGPSNRSMGSEEFRAVLELLWEYLDHDPVMRAPEWKHSDPTGWAIRYIGLQARAVRIPHQCYGLAAALFTAAMPRASDEPIDIPTRVEEILGMSPEVFMRAGSMAHALRLAGQPTVKLPGTITTQVVVARPDEFGVGVAENWSRFISLTAVTQAEFKQRDRSLQTTEAEGWFDLFRFNVLRERPLINTGGGRFVAADPELVIARTSLGMYFDLLKSDGMSFTQAFGFRYANVVGMLTRAACGDKHVWSESQMPRAVRESPPSRNADHAVVCDGTIVLIECKSVRPNAMLLMLGDSKDAEILVDRIAEAVIQLADHADAISRGEWSKHGLPASDCIGIVVTYGWIPAVNGLLFRENVNKKVLAKRSKVIPYLVLSIEEYDSLLRLVEHGHAIDTVVRACALPTAPGFPGVYSSSLANDAISNRTRKLAESFLSTVPG